MSKRKSDKGVTPPPRRVTQALLFEFDSSGNVAAPVVAPAAEDQPATPGDDGDSAPDSAKGAAAPPSPPPKAGSGTVRNNGPLSRLIDDNFLQFASYSICHRAIPTVEDGLKPVQRRILHTLSEMDDGRFIKVATVVGRTMFYHPHGDSSIEDALVNLTNKRYLIEGQGNFGNIITGDRAAASRYIECRLTDLAKNEVFNKKTTAYMPSYDGRLQEPILLPSKLPLLLMIGADGIAVGLSTTVFPHNFMELLEAEIAIIQKKPFQVFPDFPTGGLVDVSEYHDGAGKIKVRAKIEPRGNSVVITELPYGQTTQSLLPTIEEAVRSKKIQVRQIHDLTAEKAEIELVLSQGASAEKTIKALYAFTACEGSISSNIIVLENNRPVERTVTQILQSNVNQLLSLLEQELRIRKGELMDAWHEKSLIQIFIENRIYKRIEECDTYEKIQAAIREGFEPFKKKLIRPITDDDVEMLLQVRIRRISLYDMSKNREEIAAIKEELAQIEKDLGAIKPYTIRYLKDLIKKYKYMEIEVEEKPDDGDDGKKPRRRKQPKVKKVTVERFPRLTTITTFGAIDERALTATELTVNYDRETGYLGFAVRGGEEQFKCSSLDKILLVWPDGRFRVMPVPDKFFVDKNLMLCNIFNRDQQYTMMYSDADYGFSYLKRFTFGGVIMNKDYSCLPEKGEVQFIQKGTPQAVYVKYKPAKNQRIHQQKFTLDDVMVKGVRTRGLQITVKAIQKFAIDTAPRWWEAE